MAGKAVELDVKIATSADVDAFDKVASSARGMGDSVDSATGKAAAGASRLDSVGASADNLDSKASKATGALGALSAGFELVGAEKYAGALQGAAMATDFASGVGQTLNLVLELESAKRAKAALMSARHTIATKAATVATKAGAVGQWALNAALNANPLGLVVAALALMAAGVVIAYKKSETFRNIVDTAFGAAKKSVQTVVDTIGDIAGKVGDAISWVRDKLPPAVETAKGKVVEGFNAMLSPITTIYNKVVNLIEKIASIKIPKVDLNPFNRSAGASSPFSAQAPSGVGGDVAGLLAQILDAVKGNRVEVSALDIDAVIRLLRRNGYVVGKAAR